MSDMQGGLNLPVHFPYFMRYYKRRMKRSPGGPCGPGEPVIPVNKKNEMRY